MKLAAICLGHPEILPGKTYRTGINKIVLNASAMVDANGLVGDAVCNRKHHGGPDQALLLEGSLTRDWWKAELSHDVPPGGFGENLLVAGLDNRDIAVGDRFYFDEVALEVTSCRIPCATLAAKMGDSQFVKRYAAAGRPGIYCRVLRSGMIAAGEVARCELFSGERIMLTELLSTFGKRFSEGQKKRFLAAPVSERLRAAILAS